MLCALHYKNNYINDLHVFFPIDPLHKCIHDFAPNIAETVFTETDHWCYDQWEKHGDSSKVSPAFHIKDPVISRQGHMILMLSLCSTLQLHID